MRALTAAEARRGYLGIGPILRGAATLPATTTSNIFTITGAPILVTSFYGEVTSACSATATNLLARHVPTSGTNYTFGLNVAVASLAVGTLIVAEGDGTALLATTGIAAWAGLMREKLILGTGSIQIETSATNTGQVRWVLHYIPLEDASLVVAA